jgi:hypothetical protein
MALGDPAVGMKSLKAVASARPQEKPGLKTVPIEFEVPYQRFWRPLSGLNSKPTRPGDDKRLSDAQEGTFKLYLETVQNMGASLQLGGMGCAANCLLKKSWEAARVDAPERATTIPRLIL